jgi:amino acid transporter
MSHPIPSTDARPGVASVVRFVLSAAAPLTVVAGVVPTGYGTVQSLGLPFGLAVMTVVLAVFSVGYLAMSRHITNAGTFYPYVSNGLGRPLGIGAAAVALLAYNALQIGLYGLIGSAVTTLLGQWFDVNVAWWVIALAAWLLVTIMGVRRVNLNGKVLAGLVAAEILVIAAFDVTDLTQPTGPVAFDTLLPHNLFAGSAAGAVLVLAFLGLTGFESAVVFAEEGRRPRRTVAVATYLSLALIGIIGTVSAWAMSVATGPGTIVAASQNTGPATVFQLAADRLPAAVVDIGAALFVTSVLAAMIALHNTIARYTFALGREGVLPAAFRRIGRRSGAPVTGSLVQSGLALVVIVGYAVSGLDPVRELFFWVSTGGAFGLLVLVALTSVAVFVFFLRRGSLENVWRRTVAPAGSALVLIAVIYLAVVGYDKLLGVAPDHPLRWLIPLVYLIVALLGIGWGRLLRDRRPEAYQAIGLGANSVSGLASQSRVVASQYAPQHGGGAPTAR